MTLPEAWDWLRQTRAHPPGAASEGETADIYRAALQQSEDLALAAKTTGRAARPLPLFYALSQAGQAIEACCGAVGSKRHGLSLVEGMRPVLERELRVYANADGRFQSVSDCVRSARPATDSTVALVDLVASLPELAVYLRPELDRPAPLELRQDVILADGGSVLVQIIGGGFEPSWDEAILLTPHQLKSDDDLHALAGTYPSSLAIGPEEGAFECLPTIDGRWETMVHIETSDGGIDAIAPEYRGSRWLRPCIPPLGETPTPLMTWWLLAYALSMLARYQPVDWVKALDVDASPDAVLLDRAMMEALRVLPQLVLEAVTNAPRQ